MVSLRQIAILTLLLVGCSKATPQPVVGPVPTKPPHIVGGLMDPKTNTFKDEATGKVYSLDDQIINEETMEAYYPSDEEIANKIPEVLRAVAPKEGKPGVTIPEEYKGYAPFKLEDGKLLMFNKQFEYQVIEYCPGNNSILEIVDERYPENNAIYQFSDMKWKEIKEIPANAKRLN